MDNIKSHLRILICLSLIILTLILFWNVQNHDFVNFDDPIYILENHHVKAGLSFKGITWAFTTLHGGFWFPMTWLSHMLDCELYGLNPKGHHLNNLLLHIINTLLLFLILNRMTGALWKSTFVAVLFAFHPLHVEPVAWVSGRKDILSTLFWMLTVWAYLHYTEHPSLKRYLLMLSMFILGLMSKPMIVTLPLILLLLDYWPLNRFSLGQLFSNNSSCEPQNTHNIEKRTGVNIVILEKAPLIFLSFISITIVYFAEYQYGAIRSLDSFPLGVRSANALVTFITYIFKSIWPHDLTFFYPHKGMPPWWKIIGSGLLLLFASFVFIKHARRHPYLAVGWLWYLISLLPVIGLVQVGVHSMADRYTYIPLIGLSIMLSWGISNFFNRIRCGNWVPFISGGIFTIFLMSNTWIQIGYWRNGITLFSHAIEVNSNNYFAHNNLGLEFFKKGELDKAIHHFSEALRIRPYSLEINNNMGAILARLGRLDEAISYFSWVTRMDPNSAGANFNIGIALNQQGSHKEAASHFSKALRIKPDYPEAHFNLGIILYKDGKFNEAVSHFSKAIYFKPDFTEARHNLEITLQKMAPPEVSPNNYNK
ncbi:MAG: tetratricopeptide repeat protein [Deltaproteobacteria bacterium]|nr:tetratricopeptide repeat protein [Deltaproteobacteria bacterium]